MILMNQKITRKMNKTLWKICLPVPVPFLFLVACSTGGSDRAVRTEMMKWHDGKRAAISITYDDNSINQFRVALPLMEQKGLKGTFFINTGFIPGSRFHARYIGRPVEEIIAETATIPTGPENLFERASAVPYLGFPDLGRAQDRAGEAVDDGNIERACRIIDETYKKARAGKAVPKRSTSEPAKANGSENSGNNRITWDEIREFAGRGQEFACHTISHPRLAVLDEVNMRWELEKCGEEILNQLGPEHTFSCECPFGTEDERVMEVAWQIYPALRNRMPHPWLEELNRSSRRFPGASEKTYVQWQRGPLSGTSLETMNGWIDTCLQHDHIWLVLVIHGVDGIGWEPLNGDTLDSYFNTISSHGQELWVAPFREVTKYIRERMSGTLKTTAKRRQIVVELGHELDLELYNLPLTLRTYIPDRWEQITISQAGEELNHLSGSDDSGKFIQYRALPNTGPILIEPMR
jgi:peptidoglycan/xylan/chitin deacetylase (PgdA/CDA1 family)